MKFTWKTHKNYTGTIYYTNYRLTNWNAQIREYNIAGTNQRTASPAKKVYKVYVNDGYGNCSKFDVIRGLSAAKHRAESMLINQVKKYKGAA